MISKKKVIELAEQRFEELGKPLYIVEIVIFGDNNIYVEIDHEETSVSIEDCVAVSRNIEHNLDREEEDFQLEVSSAGLDKPLRNYKQYVKNIGRSLKVKLVEQGKLEGKLIQADKDQITLETERKERVEGKKKKINVIENIVLPYDKIGEAKIVISFK
jgi:ribosome maturation factor RimP